MKIVESLNEKPQILLITANGRFEQGIIRHIAYKLDHNKKVLIYSPNSLRYISTSFKKFPPGGLGHKVIDLLSEFIKQKFEEIKYIIIIIDREHIDMLIKRVREKLPSIYKDILTLKEKRYITTNLCNFKIIFGVCGQQKSIEEDLANLAEEILHLQKNSLPRNKKLIRELKKKGEDYYSLIEKASLIQLKKNTPGIYEPLRKCKDP